jgi:hypothetical protein
MEMMSARRKVLLLMLCSLALRIITAASIELGNDEVYYWLYPRYPSWSYFDHPAMLAWAVRILNLGKSPNTAWALRLPALLFGTLNIYLAFLLGSRLKNALCGYYAALLYASSIYVSVICGVFILPDTAQSFFWMLALLTLANLLFGETWPARRSAPAPGQGNRGRNGLWLLFGLLTGLAVLSKYHGVFLWAGAGLYLLIRDRKELADPFVYLGGVITLVCLFPILYWNSHHEWASFVYHGNRTLGTRALVNWDNVLQQILGEFFYNSLPVVALIFVALFVYRRNKYLEPRKFIFLLCMSLPLIAFVWVMSGRRETLPHWTGPSYLSLMMLPAAWLAQKRMTRAHPGTPGILWVCSGFILLVVTAGIIQINTGWLDLTGDKPTSPGDKTVLNKDFHKDDFTLDMYGWDKTRRGTDSLLNSLVAAGELSPGYQFLQIKWFNGAHVDFYVANPGRKRTLVLGPLNDIHEYYWINQWQDWSKVTDYCLVTNSRDYQGIDQLPAVFRNAVHRTDTLPLYRSGRLAEAIFVTVFRNIPPDSVKALVYQPY